MTKKNDNRPILCGTDFSAVATEAVDVAAAMARRLETKLVLAHVDDFGPRDALAMPYEVALAEKGQALECEAKRLRKFGTVVEKKLLIGSAFDGLVTAAVESKGQLIVVGAVGRSLPRRLLIGSVAERTAEASPIPTLVVRPAAKFGTWIRGKHALRILVGYDFSAVSDAALRWVNQMQRIGACETIVLYSSWPPDEARRLGYEGPLPLSANPEEIQKNLERDLAQRVATFLPGQNVTAIAAPGWGNPEGYLFETASRHHVDLVVVGTHRRHGLGRVFLGSVSRAVLRHAKVTVAVVPVVENEEPPSAQRLDRVLVATDFSALGNKALTFGCAVLHRGGRLKLIYVAEPAGSEQDSRKSRVRKILDRLRSLVPPQAGEQLTIEAEVLEKDNPAEAIAQAAERFDADLICLGSDGRTGLAKALLGSVAQGVMKKSKRPVLVVR